MTRDPPEGWFEALGEPVPEENVAFAAEQARKMGVTGDLSDLNQWVGGIADAVERDDPEVAVSAARERLDVTGAYRLLAHLCVGPVGDGGGDTPDDTAPLSGRLRAAADSLDDARTDLDYGDRDVDAFPDVQQELAAAIVEKADHTIESVERELRQMATLAEAHEELPDGWGDLDGE